MVFWCKLKKTPVFCWNLLQISCFFRFFAQKMLKMTISTILWNAQHPNAGQNIQHMQQQSVAEAWLSHLGTPKIWLTGNDCFISYPTGQLENLFSVRQCRHKVTTTTDNAESLLSKDLLRDLHEHWKQNKTGSGLNKQVWFWFKRAFVVTSTKNHRINILFNIIEIFK